MSLSSNMASSGYFCTTTTFQRKQPKWCCLDGRVNDIPGCDELDESSSNNDNTSVQNGIESLNSHDSTQSSTVSMELKILESF